MARTTTKLKTSASKSKGIESRIKPVAQVGHSASYAIYGRAGSGKTTLASTFPKPLLLVDINDKGTDSIKDVKGVDVIEIHSLDDLEDLYYDVLRDGSKYKSVVFDTMTELQKIIMKHVVLKKNKKDLVY